ncbi:Predicted metal-dependent hydrolase of the TIM-barrel fold [Aedoeadaptatus ivorii]|uniref:Predicted metal-dependent hydrolase of the TIM-barrel fold n=1 Tax=Aedoeadaptatus ivorii TaxID=54006 RepID=A0A3S4YLI3_9FIRM|nr:amidohydrolase family protein [Peptoniphilus ivorii]MDQ0508767.1 putative TIM-barrel fold metal-dependent hydrolase [Peptoniphilus ivorii]VEJ36106.1 Predicted metal-dependent hydrolase of the TIM-barrel fold [Peptoniphilus ivorii]
MKKIDAHTHLGDFGGWANVAFTKEVLIEQMKTYDIEKTFVTGSSFHDNDRVVDAFQSYPDAVVPFVWVNPLLDDVDQKLERYIVDEGFMGIKMQPLFDAFVADDPVVDPVMEFAKAHDVPVFIHCGHPPFSLPWSIALLAERYPEVDVTMIHMGHGHGVYIEAALNMARRYDNLYLEMSGMPMGVKIKEAYETVGKDRILFGIDSPFHHPTVEIQKVLTCGLDDDALQDVFYNNAKKLLKL